MILTHGYVLLVVMIGWILFRAETLSGAIAFLRAMAGLNGASPAPYAVSFYLTPALWLALIAGVLGSFPWTRLLARRQVSTESRTGWVFDAVSVAALCLVLFASILQIAARSYSPFIYFRF
jgi:alginate O-acetyltransferase complex protein AlgI